MQISPIFYTKDLMVGYNTPCTHPISFTISKPGLYALIGPNGSGKSTFLKTLVGLIKPINGLFKTASHRKSSYVPQVHSVNPYYHLSMYNFIVQGYGPKFKMRDENRETILKLAQDWQLSHDLDKCFHELSGGQKTRAMIIRALVSNSDTLFLDEPLASLDACCQNQLMTTLADIVEKQKACVFIADHHLERFKHIITEQLLFEKQHDDALTHVYVAGSRGHAAG